MELLKGQGADVEIVEYLKEPPTVAELKRIAALLNLRPKEFVRKGESRFKELALDIEDDENLFEAISTNPVILERPIVVTEGAAVVGRPPEMVLELL